MLKLLRVLVVLGILGSVPAWCALTCVSDTLYDGAGGLANGTIRISWPTFQALGDLHQVPAGSLTVPVVNGILSVSLEPTDNTLPSNIFYTVLYSIVNGPPRNQEFWLVPTSGICQGLSALRTLTAPTPGLGIVLSQVSGATAGSVIFAAASGTLTQDNARFFWDDTNFRLGLLTATPATTLDVNGVTSTFGTTAGGSRINGRGPAGAGAGIWLQFTDNNAYFDSMAGINFRIAGSTSINTGISAGGILFTTGGIQLTGATQPTCVAGLRGLIWYTAGGTGTKDTVNVCTKDAADAYNWRSIY